MAGLIAVAGLLALLAQDRALTAHADTLNLGLGPHTVTGRVVTASGSIPPKLQVMIHYPTERGASGSGCELKPDGRFVAHGLGNGTYVFSLEPVSDGPLDHPSGFESGSTVVTVRDSDIDDVVITAAAGTTVRGSVRFDETRPGAMRPENVVVHAALAKTEWAGPFDSAPVREDGTFEIPDVHGPRVFKFGWTATPGTYWTPRKVLLDGREITNVPVDFSTEKWTSLEIVFTQGWTGIIGRVEDIAGLPVSACVVMLPEDPDLRRGWSTAVGTAESDGRGRFYFSNMPAGDYFLLAHEAETCPPAHEVVASARDVPRAATRASVAEGATVRVVLTAATRSSRP